VSLKEGWRREREKLITIQSIGTKDWSMAGGMMGTSVSAMKVKRGQYRMSLMPSKPFSHSLLFASTEIPFL
jgi:hypothetical protein